MNIFVAIPEKFAGCGFYRQYQPHNRLAKTHSDVNVLLGAGLRVSETEFVDVTEYDIVQFHKGYFDLEAIKHCRAKGVTVIADFDDWWRVDTEHVFYRHYLRDKTSDQLISLLRAVDYITCTTERLADEIRKFNRNVVVLPNAMDMNYPQCKIERVKEENIIFAYLGGHCHSKDVAQLSGVNNRLSSEFTNYKFRLMGVDGTEIYNQYSLVLSDAGRLAPSYFDWVEKADIWNYPKLYNYLDVSLVPLVGNKFNSLKSELKLIEAGFFRKAVICDNVEPYRGLLRHKQNAMVVNKYQNWYKYAKYLLQNPEAISELGEALYETVQPYGIDEVNKKRYKFYQDVLAKRNINSSNRYSRVSNE